MRMNPKIAGLLGYEIPAEEKPVNVPALVEAHELPRLNNPDLPDMTDIDRRTLEGEKDLDHIIGVAKEQVDELRTLSTGLEIKYRGRFVEAINMALATALQAVQTKIDSRFKKKELRMKEADFTTSKKTPGLTPGRTTYNTTIFTGTREDMLKQLEQVMRNK